MLNELFSLHKSLQKCGLVVPQLHPWIKPLAKTDGFIVGIDKNGNVASIEFCPRDKMRTLWKIEESFQNKFPAIKVTTPIWKAISDNENIVALLAFGINNDAERLHYLEDCFDRDIFPYHVGTIGVFDRQIFKFTEQLMPHFQVGNTQYEAFPILINRLVNSHRSAETFLKQLTQKALAACKSGKITEVSLVQKMLVGKWNPKYRRFDNADVLIVLDVSDYQRYSHCVAHPDMKDYVNERLLQKADDSVGHSGMDSLTGQHTASLTSKFACPNLPILGPTILMAMFEDAPCHFRYGFIGAQIYPVGTETDKALYGAISFITDKSRKGKTWSSVPGHNKKTIDLLIVYLEEKPQAVIELASLFAEESEEDNENEHGESAFESVAASVCSALDCEPGITQNSAVQLLVITKIDPGRKQIVLSERFSVGNIRGSTDEWRRASLNGPILSIPLPTKKGEKTVYIEPKCPSPSDIMRIMQNKWIKLGKDKRRITGCSLREVYDVFFGDPLIAQSASSRLLQHVLQRASPLLIGIGGAKITKKWKEFTKESRFASTYVVSLISILLYKLGSRKETYMKEAAFNVGRMLSLADLLHKEYCRHLRKSSPPAQMIGNALMATALDNPERGLARLSERLPIYKAWADKVEGEEGKWAKWALGQMGQISVELDKQEIPVYTNDLIKAHILLGYLARYEKKESE